MCEAECVYVYFKLFKTLLSPSQPVSPVHSLSTIFWPALNIGIYPAYNSNKIIILINTEKAGTLLFRIQFYYNLKKKEYEVSIKKFLLVSFLEV